MSYMKKKIAFVLAGGGASGSYQLGCIKALYEKGIKPDVITANSAGALNAGALSFSGLDDLEKMWLSIKSMDCIFKKPAPFFWRFIWGHNSFYNSEPLKEKIKQMVRGKKAQIPVVINTVNLLDGKLWKFTSHHHDFEKLVLASASIPILTEPVDGIWIDGGVRENTPLRTALNQGATEVYVLINSPKNKEQPLKELKKCKGIKDIAARTIEIMGDEGHWEDMDIKKFEDNNKIKLHVIMPKENVIGLLDFEPKKIRNAIKVGYENAKEFIENL